jgi:hypothetical protein
MEPGGSICPELVFWGPNTEVKYARAPLKRMESVERRAFRSTPWRHSFTWSRVQKHSKYYHSPQPPQTCVRPPSIPRHQRTQNGSRPVPTANRVHKSRRHPAGCTQNATGPGERECVRQHGRCPGQRTQNESGIVYERECVRRPGMSPGGRTQFENEGRPPEEGEMARGGRRWPRRTRNT